MFDSEVIWEITEDSGRLINVEYTADKETKKIINSVIFSFEKIVFTAYAVDEDDSVLITTERMKIDINDCKFSANTLYPWSKAVGLSIRWLWTLINQQGYPDGVQIEFAKDIYDTAPVGIQLIVSNSEIHLYEIRPLDV
jgi:hypothetical protein